MAFVGWPSGLRELSAVLGVAPQRIYALANQGQFRYVDIRIPKSDGGMRPISIPIPELKGLQRLLARRLWGAFPVSEIAHGYMPHRSILTAARKHVGDTYILRIDLQSFFPSFTAGRIFGYLRSRGVNKSVSSIITRLVTHENRLPQGAPTSPGLTNAICYAMDGSLTGLAKSWRLTVTRYSDDIIFSGCQFNWRKFADVVERLVRRHGFEVKRSKTRYLSPDQGQRVLGLLVDSSRVRMTRKMRRTTRAAFFKAGNEPAWGIKHLGRLRGFAEFHKMIYGADEHYTSFRATLKSIKAIRMHEPIAPGS